jgi:hypothetical protein
VGRLTDGGETLGYVSGVVFQRFGFRIFGSPFAGWSTPFIGFNLLPGISRRDALRALDTFALRDLGCAYVEVYDRLLAPEDAAGLGYEIAQTHGYVTDLTQDQEAIFGRMKSMTRRCIRKAEKSGVVIERAEPEGFASEYYSQLEGVFERKGLPMPFREERVRALIDCVHPSGDLLLLRARDPDGRGIATAIYAGYGELSSFWGNASLRECQLLRPNQALHWHALLHWKERGVRIHEWGGPGSYKEAYGPTVVPLLKLRKAKHRVVGWGRNVVQTCYQNYRNLRRAGHRVISEADAHVD